MEELSQYFHLPINDVAREVRSENTMRVLTQFPLASLFTSLFSLAILFQKLGVYSILTRGASCP